MLKDCEIVIAPEGIAPESDAVGGSCDGPADTRLVAEKNLRNFGCRFTKPTFVSYLMQATSFVQLDT